MQADNPQNHPIFYFTEGNLVFACKTKDGLLTYFRIHQSYLAPQSSVVSDLLTLPGAGANQEVYDGVPAVYFPASIGAEAMELFLTFF